jgi:uncharacterized delta-60 repeat protein
MSNRINDIREFGSFRLDAQKCVLWHGSDTVNIPLKEIEVLCALTENSGEVVTKDELLQKVWADSFVEESNLSRHVYRLRKMFDRFGEKDLIQTVPRRGYRFTGSVNYVSNGELIIERHSMIRTVAEFVSSDQPERRSRLRIVSTVAGAVVLCAIVAGWLTTANRVRTAETPNAVNSGFAAGNAVTTGFGYRLQKAWAIALQSDGKLLAGGWAGDNMATSQFAIARYQPDGVLDESFGVGGKTVTAMGPNMDIIYALAVQPDGRILAAGVDFIDLNRRRFCVVRYKPDGALDPSFDGDGIVTMNIGTRSMDTAYAVAVQPDGKILLAGSAFMLIDTPGSQPSQNDFGLLRLNADGSVDTDFGDHGKVITDFGFGSDIAYSMALQNDGRIVLAGVATNGTDQDLALARFLSDGTLDPKFGKNGHVRTDISGGEDLISAITVQPDGKLVVAGYTGKGDMFDVAAARYTEDGSLDNTFGDNGKVTIDVRNHDIGRAVAVQPDGRIVIGVYSDYDAASQFAAVRLSPDGKPDEAFGTSGRLRLPLQKNAGLYGMVLTADGSAVLAGSTGDPDLTDFALVWVRL